jgi:hypothetical protein
MNNPEEIKIESQIISTYDFDSLKNIFNTNHYYNNDVFFDKLKKENLKLYKVEYMTEDDGHILEYINFNYKLKSMYSHLSKHIFVCFRLFVNPINFQYVYQSWWIVNSKNKIINQDIFLVKDMSDEIDDFSANFNANSSDEILSEIYLI